MPNARRDGMFDTDLAEKVTFLLQNEENGAIVRLEFADVRKKL